MSQPERDTSQAARLWQMLFVQAEHSIYIALGALLALTAAISLGNAAYGMWNLLLNWNNGQALFSTIDRLLFVLMLAEILHTVRVSIRSGSLTPEPFLIVGLIASIRRVLVITLESSQGIPGVAVEASGSEFRSSMIELGVLAGLILVMVISIYLIRSSGRPARPDGAVAASRPDAA